MLDLVKIESVTASPDGERQAAQFIYDRLSKLEYFKCNPQNLRKIEVNGKNYFAVSALVKSSNSTARTVILTGHFDVVDADDCGPIKQWAFDPEEYTKRIAVLKIPDEARSDLDSGRYLFGRGVADMKLGIAIEMEMIREFSENTAMFDVNIMFLGVPDEEGDSFGMRAAVEPLLKMQKDGLDFLVCINTEPSFVDGKHANEAAVFHGTIGKMMPFFMCVGREAHVGKYDDGLNSLLIASYLNIIFEGGEKKVACLYMRDQRKSYAVTLPERTAMYFNYLSMTDTPAMLLGVMREAAAAALKKAAAHTGTSYDDSQVICTEELIAIAAERSGKKSDELLKILSEDLNLQSERERNIEAVHRLIDISGEKGPFVVYGFLPPFYPARENRSRNLKEKNLETAIHKLSEFTGDKFSVKLHRAGIMVGITDLSFTGFDANPEEIYSLAKNIPLWGRGYEIPLEALSKLNIPVLNLGPIGKDCHKITERVDMEFSLNLLPQLLRKLITLI